MQVSFPRWLTHFRALPGCRVGLTELTGWNSRGRKGGKVHFCCWGFFLRSLWLNALNYFSKIIKKSYSMIEQHCKWDTVLNLFIRSQPSMTDLVPLFLTAASVEQTRKGLYWWELCQLTLCNMYFIIINCECSHLISWGSIIQRKTSEETKPQRKTFIQRSFRQSLQHQKTTKVQVHAERCVIFTATFYKWEDPHGLPDNFPFWLNTIKTFFFFLTG